MSRFTWFIVIVVLLLAGVIVYNKVINPPVGSAPGPGAGGPPKEMPVNAYVVKPLTVSSGLTAAGSLLAFEAVELHPEVSGKVIQLNIMEGTTVAKGSLLVKLFDADLQAQLKKLKLQQETAQKTEQRLKQLLAANGIGQQEYDNALTQLNNIEADIEYTQAQISKTEIRAPFDGVVGLKSISPGAYVTPATAVASFQQVNSLKLDFTVPERYMNSIKKGDVVKFTIDGLRGKMNARVVAVEPKIDELSRQVRIRAVVQNAGNKLLPGAFAKVDIGLTQINDALLIPTQCVIPEARNKKVVVVRDGKAQFANIITGVRTESKIQVTDGVQVGDTLVATAIMGIRPGMDIKVTRLID